MPSERTMTLARQMIGEIARAAIGGKSTMTDAWLAEKIEAVLEAVIADETAALTAHIKRLLGVIDACAPDVPGEPCPACYVRWDGQVATHERGCALASALGDIELLKAAKGE